MAPSYDEDDRSYHDSRHRDGPPEGCILSEFPETTRSCVLVGAIGLILVLIVYHLFFK